MFDSFGGHAHAAGMQMPVERVADFAERFELLVQQNIAPESESPVVEIAGEIRFEQITPQFWQSLKQFAPFGPDNMNPVFVAYNVQDTGRSKRLDNNHVRLALKQGDATFSAVGFGLADQFEQMRNRTFDIVFNLREEEWRGETVVSLVIKDIR
jgi:single-stranded-DNA-specific exonuclease